MFVFSLLLLFGCSPDLEELRKKAEQLESQQDYNGALGFRKQIFDAEPNSLDALYNRGVCYQGIGVLPLAEKDYLKVLKKDSMHLEANFNLGALYQVQRNLKESVKLFSRIIGGGEAVLNINTTQEIGFNIYNESIYQRGNAHFMNQNWELAQKDFKRCLALNYKSEKSKELISFCKSQLED